MSSKKNATGDTINASQLFTRQELVGRGAYGAVYKGIDNETKQVVAIKVLNLDTDEEDVSDIQREIATLSQLKNCDSQNITRYHGSFLNGTKLWIVMDYAAGGSIRSLLQALTKIDEKCIAVIAREVLQALSYLHKHHIIHRDIKAANILLTDQGRVQLCDFGVAGQVTMNSLKRNSFVGTPYWMAPEVIKEGQTYDFKADIWSFGITIYEIATGNPPFADQDPMRAVSLIPKSRPAQLEGDWSPAMKEFVALCLHEEPNERPSAEDLLKTKWIKSAGKSSPAILKELVARYEQHKQESEHNKDETSSDMDIEHELEGFDMDVDPDTWRFDTAKTVPTMAPSRASSVSRPSLDSKHEHSGSRSPVLSMQDSGVVIQSRSGGKQSEPQQKDVIASMPSTSAPTSPTIKAKSSTTSPRNVKKQIPAQTQPAVISHESHPLLRLFMKEKSASDEDVSTSHSLLSSPGLHMVSAPITLTIPNLEDITNARLASRSPAPTADASSSSNVDQFYNSQQQHPHHSSASSRHPESARLPFGFNMTKSSFSRFDRRPSAPVLMGSTPSSEYPLYNHQLLNRGAASNSPLSSPRAMVPPPPPPSSLLSNHQGAQSSNLRPSSTPNSPAIPPVAVMGSTAGTSVGSSAGLVQANGPTVSKEAVRSNGSRRPSPTVSPSTGVPQQQHQPQQHSRGAGDSRSTLPPAIPHRKASLDFSQSERFSHLRPSLPMRPPSAAAVRSSTFHGMESTGATASTIHSVEQSNSHGALPGSFTGSLAGISSGIAALGMQPININEEKLPPFGHSPAHLKMLNVLADIPPTSVSTSSPASANGVHRGSVSTVGEKDGFSPASSVNSEATFGQMSYTSHSHPNYHAATSSSSSASSSLSSASIANSTGTNQSPGSVLARPGPGLRTVGSSENFARRIRSTSVLKQEQESQSKSAVHPGRALTQPTTSGGSLAGQQSHPSQQHPSAQQSHYQQHHTQHQGYPQQQQSSYPPESSFGDMSRYRRASSPRRRSISMTNLNGGLSVIMIPPKKNSVDDYAPNPLLLPPSPSTTRFIAPSSISTSTLSSSPLRPTLHSMASSSSLSSSYGSISGHANGGRGSNASQGLLQQQQQQQQQPSSSSLTHGSSFLTTSASAAPSSLSTAFSTSPSSLGQIPNNSSTISLPNMAPTNSTKSVMGITSPLFPPGSNYSTSNANANANNSTHFLSHHNASTSTLVASNSQQHLSQHLSQQQHYHQQQQHHQHSHHGSNSSSSSGHPQHTLTQQQQHLQQQQQQQQQHQLQNVPMHLLMVTPEPRMLQMDALRRNEDLLEELQLTVNDLSQWLQVFETGIKSVRS
ncbi:hypothetical protein BGX28_003034 [Mortierella sp. GBA30]|nr:hypothetical protein BGX28_003034 [Mortierella sp. GBA30]